MLAATLGLFDYQFDLHEGATLDYHFGSLWWAKEQGFNTNQTLEVLKIAQELFLQTKG